MVYVLDVADNGAIAHWDFEFDGTGELPDVTRNGFAGIFGSIDPNSD